MQTIMQTVEHCNMIEGFTSNTNFRKKRLDFSDNKFRSYKGYIDWKKNFEGFLTSYTSLGHKITEFNITINRDLDYTETLLVNEINSTKFGTILNIKNDNF